MVGEGSPVQICSGLKDRGCLARPLGLNPPGLVGTELQRMAVRDGCGCKSVEESYKNHYNIQKGLSLSDFSCNFAESVITLTTSGLGERFHTMALMFFRVIENLGLYMWCVEVYLATKLKKENLPLPYPYCIPMLPTDVCARSSTHRI